MAHLFIVKNVVSTNPPTYTDRGYITDLATAQAYNNNFYNSENPELTTKIITHASEGYDVTGLPELDENDNEV